MNAKQLSELRKVSGLLRKQYRMRAEFEPEYKTAGIVEAYNILHHVIEEELKNYGDQFPV